MRRATVAPAIAPTSMDTSARIGVPEGALRYRVPERRVCGAVPLVHRG